MPEGLSHRIVAFIANLHPLYTQEMAGGQVRARSLVDGTLILPISEPEDDEDGQVEIHWQGDPARHSEVRGAKLASLAVARYVELHAIPGALTTRNEYAHMSQHFSFKTGDYLMLQAPSPESMFEEKLRAARELLGREAVIEIFKKVIGF